MSYAQDSELVILNKYGKAGDDAKAELFETYDRLRDLAVSGPTLGGSGMGKFGSMLMNVARMFSASPFIPTFGSEAINIPGTSYYAPMTGGTGITNGGQAAFGLAPFSQSFGLPNGGAAAPIYGEPNPLALFSAFGIGSSQADELGFDGIGDFGFPQESGTIGGISSAGRIVGAASPVATAGAAGGLATGTAAGAGFGRNWVMPAAGIMSGIGGLLTTLGPFFGPYGLAGAAAGSVLNGISGAILHSFQHVSNRLLVNADTILTTKIKNLETVVKMLDAQQDIVKKLLKESLEGDKKMLDNL